MPSHESLQINSSLMDATPDCVKVLDLDGRLMHMNTPGLCAMEIDDFSTISQQHWRALWPDAAGADIAHSLAKAINGESCSFEAYCPTAKGTPKWWDVSVTPVRNASSGQIEQILAVSRDVTHRRNIEKSLQLSESRLAKLHGIMSNPRLSNPDRLARLVRLGVDEFNLEIGVVAQVTDDAYRVWLADTPDGSVPVGYTCHVNDVICAETLRRNGSLAIESLAKSDWQTHPAHSKFGTEVYFGMPLVAEGHIFGTLCYTSRQSRAHQFSTGDHEFLRLLAQTLGTEMTRQKGVSKLLSAEAEFRAMFELSPVGMTQVSVATGKYIRVNPQFCELTGYTAEELMKLTPEDITHTDDRAGSHSGDGARHALHQGLIEQYHREKRYLRKDGTVIWVQANATLLRDADGRPDRTTAVIQDITGRKRVEDAMRDSQQRLQLAIRAGGLGVWETNNESGQRHWSPEAMAMLGLDLPGGTGQLGGENDEFRSRLHPDDRHLQNEFHRELSETGSTKAEYRIKLPNGKIRWLSGGASVLARNASGAPVRAVHIVSDITQRKLVEEALDESGKQFRQIVMNIAVPTMLLADDETVLVVNHMWTHITGYRLADIPTIGAWTQKAYGERSGTAKSYVDNLFNSNTRVDNGEWTVTTATGEKRVWHFSSTPLGRDSLGRRLLISTAIDVTEQKSAAQKLLDSQQFIRDVLDNLNTFVGVLTPDGTLVEANQSPLKAANIAVDDVRGKKIWDSFWWSYSPESQTTMREWCRRSALGETIRSDVQVRMANDKLMWIDFQLAPLRDAAGVITHLIPSALDITGRIEAEAKLLKREKRYRTLFDSMHQGYCIVEVLFDAADRAVDYRFIEVNAAFERHTGLTGAEGQTIRTLVPNIEPHWAEMYGKVARTGEAIRSVNKSPAVQNRWFDTYAFRLGGQGSNKVAILFSDVSAQKLAEQNLFESEQRFRNFADSLPQLAWMADVGTSGEIGWFNNVWLDYTGATQAQMKGAGWKSVIHADHIERVEQKFAHHVKNGLDWEETFPLRGKDGKYRWFLSRMKCVRDDSGNVVQLFGTNTDITSEQQLEEKLRQVADDLFNANQRKDVFLATLAHELRNPLAPIRNGLELMKLSSGQTDAAEQARAMMERQLTHMVRLVDDLMDVSRIRQGKLELRKQPMLLEAVIHSAIESSSAMVTQKRHELIVNLPAQDLVVDADLTRLAQVFQNLLNNAAKYSEAGGKIHLTVQSVGTDVAITIKDGGVGIAADQLPKIFEMFTQVDRSLDMSQGGLGIGLSLVKQLVDMHGGKVEAKSAGLGHGSEFVVTLPLLEQPAQFVTPALNAAQAAPQTLKILVVDDNQDGADSLSEMLGLMGNDTRTGYDGEQACVIAQAFQPDVILLDIGLPTLNGYEACRRIRQQPWSTNAVLVAITGWGQDKDRERTREAGFNHHLVKPVDPQALLTLLSSLKPGSSVGRSN